MIQPRPIYIDGKKYDCFQLYKDYSYTLSNGIAITIPKGFETDFASIPQFLWGVFPAQKLQYRLPALVHDYLYMANTVVVSRAFADAEFRRMLILEGVNKREAWLFWVMVRIFGGKRFKNYKKH